MGMAISDSDHFISPLSGAIALLYSILWTYTGVKDLQIASRRSQIDDILQKSQQIRRRNDGVDGCEAQFLFNAKVIEKTKSALTFH
jgi:hypothetical protein